MRALIHITTFRVLRLKVQFEKVLAVLFTDADPVVRHFDPDARLGCIFDNSEFFDTHCDHLSLHAELYRILYQVYNDLLASHLVDLHNNILLVYGRTEIN
jgi:hypothetical protein